MTKTVSVIIPAYNEEATVSGVIDQIRQALAAGGYDYEIIVVDDSSTDGTRLIVENKKGVTLISSDSNMGYGASLKRGIGCAAHEIVAIIDADGTYPAGELPSLLSHMDKYDMVVGARTGKDAPIPALRGAAKTLLRWLANYLSGRNIPDLNSGMRVMKKEAVTRFMNILPSGFSFTTTITLALLTNDYTVKYVQIPYAHRVKHSKFHPIKDTVNMTTLIIRTVLYFNPLKIFAPLGMALVASGACVFVVSAVFMSRILDVTTAILVVTGIQVVVVGLLADLIDKKTR